MRPPPPPASHEFGPLGGAHTHTPSLTYCILYTGLGDQAEVLSGRNLALSKGAETPGLNPQQRWERGQKGMRARRDGAHLQPNLTGWMDVRPCECWRQLTRYCPWPPASPAAGTVLGPWGHTTETKAGSTPGFWKWVKDFQQQP